MILIALLALCQPLFSQEVDAALPDSLQTILDKSSQDQAKRMEALNDVIDALHKQHLHKTSIPFINELDSLSTNLGNKYFHSFSEYYRGSVAFAQNDFPLALQSFVSSKEEAMTLAGNKSVRTLKAKIQLGLGATHINLLMLPQAYQNLQEGLDLNKDLGNTFLQYNLENNLLVVYRYLNLYKEIIAISKKIVANPDYSDYYKFYTYYNIAACYTDLRSYDSANLYLDTAAMCAKTTHDAALVPYYRGSILLDRKDYRKAIDDFDESLALLKETQSADIESNALIFKGKSYSMLDNMDSALVNVDAALELAERNGLLYVMERGLNVKKEILRKTG